MIFIVQEIWHYDGSSVIFVSTDLKRAYDYAVKYISNDRNHFDQVIIDGIRPDRKVEQHYYYSESGENSKVYLDYLSSKEQFNTWYDFNTNKIKHYETERPSMIDAVAGLAVGLSVMKDILK